jgi:hypothetical protein
MTTIFMISPFCVGACPGAGPTIGAQIVCAAVAPPGKSRDEFADPACDADPGRLGLLHGVFLSLPEAAGVDSHRILRG